MYTIISTQCVLLLPPCNANSCFSHDIYYTKLVWLKHLPTIQFDFYKIVSRCFTETQSVASI